jgi:hypothetical protein
MNVFSGLHIDMPEKFKEYFHAFCLTRHDGSVNSPENSPFPRMVDMWFAALCIAVNKGLDPITIGSEKTYKAIECNVLDDGWRSNALTLLSITHTGSIDVIDKPHDMLRIANSYAIAGLPVLIDILENRSGDCALDHLSEYLVDITEENTYN